jgi:hypothetical protein
MPRRRSPHYPGKIEYRSIEIPNTRPEQMRDRLNALPFLAYHVETMEDGRKICITKPGGKRSFGTIKVNDFMVWIYDETRQDRWRISHDEIYDDVRAKMEANATLCETFIERLLEVCNGAEPNQMIGDRALAAFSDLPGFPAELILKTYKWIWVEEDCNYPTGEGRWMSMNPILDLRKKLSSGG